MRILTKTLTMAIAVALVILVLLLCACQNNNLENKINEIINEEMTTENKIKKIHKQEKLL